jgi:hypothetical protein
MLPTPYTDAQILAELGPFTQGPSGAGYAPYIEAYDAAYLPSLNPAQRAFAQFYSIYANPGSPLYDPTKAGALFDALEGAPIDPALAVYGLTSIGTVQAERRFSYFYTSGPALSNPEGPQPPVVIPPTGPIAYTLVPPAPYSA